MPDAPTLYLIDGHAQMFRAYYAIRSGMTSPVTGEPTNALFAFTGMLIKLFADCEPAYAAMVFDARGKTFRDDFYPEYKANRDAPPEDFVAQIPRMYELARLFGLPILELTGYEADDIMATLATRVETGVFNPTEPDLRLKLVAKDKDLEQVISDRVVLYDVQTDQTLDTAALMDKRGLRPDQVIDYQTLIGDSTDNIPGVKGIGPKTAIKLLDQFGSVAGILDGLDQLKGKQKENLTTAAADGTIELTRRLVTLCPQTPIDFDLIDARMQPTPDARWPGIDGPGLLAMFGELGFNRHVTDLQKLLRITPAPAPGSAPGNAPAPGSLPPKPTPTGRPRPEAGAGGLFGGAPTPTPSSEKTPTSAGETSGRAGLTSGGGQLPGVGRAGENFRGLPGGGGDYRAVTTVAALESLVVTLKKQTLIAVDTETIGLGRTAPLCGVCLAWEEGAAVYIPTRSSEQDTHLDTATVIAALRPVLEDPAVPKCGHHLKYDLHVLKTAGLEMRGVVFDSMIAAFLAEAPGRGMDHLALSELGHVCIPITELIGPRPSRKTDPPQKTMDQVPLAQVTPYAAEDADITLRLCRHFQKKLDTLGLTALAEQIEMPLIAVLTDMEAAGITCDADELDRQRDGLQERIDTLRQDILNAAQVDFNPDSPKQLSDVLFNTLGFPTVKKTKTGFSTDVEVMEKLTERVELGELDAVPEHAHPLPGLMLEYRMLTKLVSTYLLSLRDAMDPTDGRVRTTFSQTGAATGRLSSYDPNLQNIPIRTEIGRQIRRAFVAAPGNKLISADYSQIELRVLAHLSQDENLTAAFDAGLDIHTAVAAQVFGTPVEQVTPEQRGRAKVINFGIIYGVTPYGLARRIDGLDNAAATALIADYKARFPGIDRFLDQCVAQATEQGHVTTLLGRRRAIPQIHSSNGQQRQLGERLAINSVVQGSAADLIKRAMIDLHQRIRDQQLPMTLLLQIHDELIVEAPSDQADAMAQVMCDTMETAMTLTVPLSVDAGIGNTWFETK